MLDLANPLKLLELWVQSRTIGDFREIEETPTECPGALVPLHGGTKIQGGAP